MCLLVKATLKLNSHKYYFLLQMECREWNALISLSLYYFFYGSSSVPAAAAKSLQSCPTLCDPIDGSPPGSPSLGFSRQEHWSGLPFPSPINESEKGKWSRSVVSYPQRPYGLQPTRLLRPWDFPGKSTGVGCHCLLWILFSHKRLFLSGSV